ncbi:MAG: hypothetical protein RL240_1624 [Planctomycetota bacterium]
MFNPKGVTGDSPGQRPGVSLVAIRCQAVGDREETLHRLATCGYLRCMLQPVTIRCQAVGDREENPTFW